MFNCFKSTGFFLDFARFKILISRVEFLDNSCTFPVDRNGVMVEYTSPFF